MSDSEERERQRRERDDELKRTPLQKSDKASWPNGVRPVGLVELNEIGVDDRGRLYWQGKPIEVRQRLSLTFWQKAAAFLVAAGALATFLVTIANGVTDLVDWGCKVGWLTAAAVCGTP